MAFTLVAGTLAKVAFTTSATPTAAYASTGPSANSLLVAVIQSSHGLTAPAQTVSGITDTLTNTWVKGPATSTVASTSFGEMTAEIWYCAKNKSTGADTLTVTLSGAATVGEITLLEFTTTNANGGTFHVGNTASISNTTTGQTTLACATASAASTGDLVVSAANIHTSSITMSNSSSYVEDDQHSTASTWSSNVCHLLSATSNTVQTCTHTFSSSRGVVGVIGTFTEAAAGGANTPQALSASVATTPTITRAIVHTFATLSVALTGAVQKNVGKAVTATAVGTAETLTAARAFTRALAASVTTVASLTSARAFLRTLAASVATTPTLAKNIGKNLTATALVLVATLRRAVAKGLAVTMTTTAAVAKAVAKAMSRTVTLVTTLTAGKGYLRTLAATVTLAPTLARTLGKVLTVSVTITATMARSVAKGLSPVVTLAPTIANAVAKGLGASVSLSPVLTAGRGFLRTLSTSVSLSASLVAGRTLQRVLSASVAVSANLSRAVGKGLEATVATAGSIGKAIGKGLTALVNLIPGISIPTHGLGIDAFTAGSPFVDWEVELQLSWAVSLTESWVVGLEEPGWQTSPPESSWSVEVST